MLKYRNCINASAPGVGKTVEVLALCEYLLQEKASKVVVFCSKYSEWIKMLAKFTDSKAVLFHGTPEKRKKLYQEDFKYLVCTYGTAINELDFLRKTVDETTVVICDEVHRIKSKKSRRAKSLKTLSLFARNRIGISATLIWNRLDDLFGAFEWVDPNYLGAWGSFKNMYIESNDYNQIVGYKNLDVLRERISPVIIRRNSSDKEVAEEMPELQVIEDYCDFEEKHLKLMQQLCIKIRSSIQNSTDNWYRSPEVFKHLTAADVATVCPIQYGYDGSKINYVLPLIEDMVSDSSVVVFCRYLDGCVRLKNLLQEQFERVFYYVGGTDDSVIEKFKATGKPSILVSSDAGRESLNIQEARYVVNLDIPWGDSDLLQRIHRIRRVDSQEDYVIARNIICPGLDEYKYSLATWKGQVSEHMLDGKELDDYSKPKILHYLDNFIETGAFL